MLYTFTAYMTPIVTFVIAVITFRKQRFPDGKDATQVYGAEPNDDELPKTWELA